MPQSTDKPFGGGLETGDTANPYQTGKSPVRQALEKLGGGQPANRFQTDFTTQHDKANQAAIDAATVGAAASPTTESTLGGTPEVQGQVENPAIVRIRDRIAALKAQRDLTAGSGAGAIESDLRANTPRPGGAGNQQAMPTTTALESLPALEPITLNPVEEVYPDPLPEEEEEEEVIEVMEPDPKDPDAFMSYAEYMEANMDRAPKTKSVLVGTVPFGNRGQKGIFEDQETTEDERKAWVAQQYYTDLAEWDAVTQFMRTGGAQGYISVTDALDRDKATAAYRKKKQYDDAIVNQAADEQRRAADREEKMRERMGG